MKNIFLVLLLLAHMLSNTYGQDKTATFIIAINDVVVDEGVSSVRLEFIGPNGHVEVAKADYTPGKLQCHLGTVKEYAESDGIMLSFTYSRYCAVDERIRNYRIPISRRWLDDPYIILKFYDMDLPKNQAFFAPKPGVKYIYELNTANGRMGMIRKAGAKEPGCR